MHPLYSWIIQDILLWPIEVFVLCGSDFMLFIIRTTPDIPRDFPDREKVRLLLDFILYEIPDVLPTLWRWFVRLSEFDEDFQTLIRCYNVAGAHERLYERWLRPLDVGVRHLYWKSQFMQSKLYLPLRDQNNLFYWWLFNLKIGDIACWDVKRIDGSLYTNRYPKANPLWPKIGKNEEPLWEIFYSVTFELGFRRFGSSVPFYDYTQNFQTLLYLDRILSVRFFLFLHSTELNRQGFYLMEYYQQPFRIKNEFRNDLIRRYDLTHEELALIELDHNWGTLK